MKKLLTLLLAFLLSLSLFGCSEVVDILGEVDWDEVANAIEQAQTSQGNTDNSGSNEDDPSGLNEDGSYTSKDDVALYLWVYGRLPDNFITKKEAEKLGWPGGSLEPYAPGCCIGGDRFGNYEGILPEGVTYTECDIDTMGAKSRGAKRIVFSSDGYIYYTDDHYESFDEIRVVYEEKATSSSTASKSNTGSSSSASSEEDYGTGDLVLDLLDLWLAL